MREGMTPAQLSMIPLSAEVLSRTPQEAIARYEIALMALLVYFFTTLYAVRGFAMGSQSSRQANVMSQQCPTGGKEAEELYQLGRKYREGHGGFPRDSAKAEKLFEESLALGNAKAALAIGQMYRIDYGTRPDPTKRYKYMVAMFKQGMKMGCPEAYQFMGECYEKGWGVRTDRKKAIELLTQAAEMGSPKAMEWYGRYLIFPVFYGRSEPPQLEPGRQWLRRSLALGNGDAGEGLADSYKYNEGSIDGIVKSLREGAALGSKQCLQRLKLLYLDGWYGQNKDLEHAACYAKLKDSISDFDRPRPIPDFDKKCPLKQPYQPFKLW
jgi:TPR repeat protein